MRQANLDRERLKAQERRAQLRNDDFVSDVLGEAAASKSRLNAYGLKLTCVESRKDDDMLRNLHIASHVHDQTFKDSPEERKIFELGLQVSCHGSQRLLLVLIVAHAPKSRSCKDDESE